MANIDVGKIRNLSLLAHSGAGKTTLAEAMLFTAGATGRMGSVGDGNTVTDFEPEEIQRRQTISSALCHCDWSGHRLNIIDTPGFINFIEEARGGLSVSDGAVIIVSATAGIKGETERVWRFADEFSLPRLVFVNEMDKENADFDGAVEQIERVFKMTAIPLFMPIGAGEKLSGGVDLLRLKAYMMKDGRCELTDIPADYSEAVGKYRKKLVEKVAESDDALIEKYLGGTDPTPEELIKGVRDGSLNRRLVPVFCGSAAGNIGVRQLLDAVVECLPSPVEMSIMRPFKGKNLKDGGEVVRKPSSDEPVSLFVFKTIADPFTGRLSLFRVISGRVNADSTLLNPAGDARERMGHIFHLQGKKQIAVNSMGPGEMGVVAKLKETVTGNTLCDEAHPVVFEPVKFSEPIISYAIEPKTKGDEDKVGIGLHKILDEDPMLHYHRDVESNEMIISGMGQVHVEVALQKLKRKFGVEVEMHSPRIPYRETVKSRVRVQGKYKKQSGGKGQFGDCWIELEPMHRGEGFEFVDKVVGGSVPRQYIPAVEKGIVDKMKQGIIAGYPLVDVRVTLVDGSYHAVDSSEMAFKIAGSMAIKKAATAANPVLLEPEMKVEISAPDEYLGALIGDINARRGKVQGMDSKTPGTQDISATVPMSEMLTYANSLQSITAGRGTYHMEFSHYEELPAHLAQKIIAEKKEEEQEE
jgi:elongation factor G